MYWGYSPALDLQEEVDCDGEELRALLVGGCDARHILKTLARAYRHPPRRLTLLVAEASEELLARQMLLLAIALEPPEALGPREKARLFMEVYGNLHLRPAGARYVRGKAAQLARDAARERGQEGGCALPLVGLARLRHRERDQLLDVLGFWTAGGRGIFRPASHWDARLRAQLGARYDSRDAVFDWDYHMRLADREMARAVDAREYRHWRRTGLAFAWPGADPRLPNCTLASGVQRLCGQLCHRGYLGDVVSGPFAAYGMRCEPEDADLLKTKNGARAFRSTDVTERNLMRLFHELQTGRAYERAPDADPGAGGVVMELPEVQDCDLEDEIGGAEPQPEVTHAPIPTGEARVVFLPSGAVQRGAAARERQDLVFVSHLLPEWLGPAVRGAGRAGTRVLAETRALAVGPREEELRQFARDLGRAAGECGCVPLAAFDGAKDPVARFQVSDSHPVQCHS